MFKDLKLTTSAIRASVGECAQKNALARMETFTETLASKAIVNDLRNEVATKGSIEH